MSGTTKNKAETLAAVQALIAGTQKHFSTGSFTVGNATFTAASMVTLLQGVISTMAALDAAELAAKEARATSQASAAQADPVIRAFTRFLHGMFAGALSTLADFGLSPPKAPAQRTAEQKTAAAVKAAATRKARGTTSKKQKLGVTGGVTGIAVTPNAPAAAASPSAPPAPATTPTAPTGGTSK